MHIQFKSINLNTIESIKKVKDNDIFLFKVNLNNGDTFYLYDINSIENGILNGTQNFQCIYLDQLKIQSN